MKYTIRLPADMAHELVDEGHAQFDDPPAKRSGIDVALIVYGVGANTVTITAATGLRALAEKLHLHRMSVRVEANGPGGRVRLDLTKAPDIDTLLKLLYSVLK